jgi:hypothetical protein
MQHPDNQGDAPVQASAKVATTIATAILFE